MNNTNPLLAEIGKEHSKSVAQAVLRWPTQRGVIAIPREGFSANRQNRTSVRRRTPLRAALLTRAAAMTVPNLASCSSANNDRASDRRRWVRPTAVAYGSYRGRK
ncbi:hypothetical protein [Streptomyces sp. NPDC059575]|uniref:hypothetical protein n=1 Tax=Streptomyces sp. NPDC059575 TaxID=3346872 RepID=UPI0036AEA505